MRRMSRCFTWFPIGVLGEPNIYQNLVFFTMCVDFYLEGSENDFIVDRILVLE